MDYVRDAIKTMNLHRYASIEPRQDATRAWNDGLQRRLSRTVWNTGGCSSWYLDAQGRNTTLWPRTTAAFRSRCRASTSRRTTCRHLTREDVIV